MFKFCSFVKICLCKLIKIYIVKKRITSALKFMDKEFPQVSTKSAKVSWLHTVTHLPAFFTYCFFIRCDDSSKLRARHTGSLYVVNVEILIAADVQGHGGLGARRVGGKLHLRHLTTQGKVTRCKHTRQLLKFSIGRKDMVKFMNAFTQYSQYL